MGALWGSGCSGGGGVSTPALLLRSIRPARCMLCPSVWLPPWGHQLVPLPGCHPNLGKAEPGWMQDHAHTPNSVTHSPVSPAARSHPHPLSPTPSVTHSPVSPTVWCHPLSRNGPSPGVAGPSLPSTLPWQNGSWPPALHPPCCTPTPWARPWGQGDRRGRGPQGWGGRWEPGAVMPGIQLWV